MCYEMVLPVCRDPQDVMPGMVGIYPQMPTKLSMGPGSTRTHLTRSTALL
jgi:hypothetical protein